MIPIILVVEDNPMNLELVRDVLTSTSGFLAWTATPCSSD